MLGLCAIALCFVPLFDLLGFEFSLAMALLVGPAAVHLGLRASSWAASARRALALLLAPLAIISLNALRVKSCNPWEGLRLYVLLPGAAAVLASGWGRAASLLLGPRLRALLAVLALGLVSVGLALWNFLSEPQISFWGAAYGWWPGALYDEALGVPDALGWSRLADLLLAGLLLAMAHNLVALRARRWCSALLLPLVAAGLPWGLLQLNRERLGFYQDRIGLEQSLGGRHQSERLVLYYPRGSYDEKELGSLVEDLSFRLDQVEAFFGLDPSSEPVRVYVYADRAQRRRLMGADRVSIAKPWLGEVHLLDPSYGDSVITHELAHVVAARFGPEPFGVPVAWGLVPNMGLVEGAAVAAQWDQGQLTPHGWSAALRRLDLAPELSTVMSPAGFYGLAASRAYTVAGSFVRFLIDRYGPARFREAYRCGDLAAAYGRPAEQIFADWAEVVDSIELGEAENEHARLRFGRPSIFRRVCAREVASVRREASCLEARGLHGDAVALRERVCRYDPGDPGLLASLLRAQIRGQGWQAARWTAAKLLDHGSVSLAMHASALEHQGDIDWLEGMRERARSRYEQAAALPVAAARHRSLAIKLWAMEQGVELGDRVRDYLLMPSNRSAAMAMLALSAGRSPEEGVPSYLLGRAMAQRGLHHEAALLLQAVLDRALPHQSIELESLRLLGRSLYLDGKPLASIEVMQELTKKTPWSGARARAEEWIERARWQERNLVDAGTPGRGPGPGG